MAVEVAEAAAQEEEAAAGEQVGVDDPDQRRLAEAEVGADRRQRDVDDGRVEHDHDDAEADDGEREPAARKRGRGGRHGHARVQGAHASRGRRAAAATGASRPPLPERQRRTRAVLQAFAMFSAENGILRTRLPFAAKMAFATAGPINAVAGSPIPPGFSLLWMSVMSTA